MMSWLKKIIGRLSCLLAFHDYEGRNFASKEDVERFLIIEKMGIFAGYEKFFTKKPYFECRNCGQIYPKGAKANETN